MGTFYVLLFVYVINDMCVIRKRGLLYIIYTADLYGLTSHIS